MGACKPYRHVSLWGSYLIDPANRLLPGWSCQSAVTWLILPISWYLVDPANRLIPGLSCQSVATWLILPIGLTTERPINWSCDLRANERPKKRIGNWHQTDKPQTDGHVDSMTDPAHRAESVKKNGRTRYRSDLSGYLVSDLWECMSADSWYSCLALSIGIRSKGQTI